MTSLYANGNPVTAAVNRAVRMVTMNHPWSIDAVVYRKERVVPVGENNKLVGGAAILGGIADEADYVITVQGACKVKFTGQPEAAKLAGDGLAYTMQPEITAMIVPVIEDEFVIEKYDRVYLILPNIYIAYEVTDIKSPENLPNGRSYLYYLQPLEQEAQTDLDNLI